VFAASAAGIATAALITPIAAGRFGAGNWITIVIASAVIFQVMFLVWPTEELMYVAAFGLNLVAQSSKICVDAIVQDVVDDAYRGRVFSFYDVVFNVAFVAAAGVAVLVVPADGFSPPVFAGIAVLYAATALGYGLARRAERRRAGEHGTEPDVGRLARV
jgi:MFS family permease